MKKSTLPTLIFFAVLVLLGFYLPNRIAEELGRLQGNILDNLVAVIDGTVPAILANPLHIGTSTQSLLAGIGGAGLICLVYLYHAASAKKYMHGTEHGSAEWGKSSDIVPFKDKRFQNNIIFTQTEMMTMEERMKQTSTDDYNRNKHVVVIGGSGASKTRGFMGPNIMQKHTNYVITDPDGSLLRTYGKMLIEDGYEIRVFDLVNREKSDKYNPFVYMSTEDDVLKLVNNITSNRSRQKNSSGDPFWKDAEAMLLQALFCYVLQEIREEDRTINTVVALLSLAEVKEDDEDFMSPLDIIFEELKAENPDHFAAKQYESYKLAAGKTAKSILIMAATTLSPFNVGSIANIVSGDTIALDTLGSSKTALFIVLPEADRTYNFLAGMMYQQMFDVLMYKADHEYGGRLPFHIRCLMDEFANIGQIPQLELLMPTIRRRGISLAIVLQNLTQIKSMYKDTWETIIGNCDSLLYLGGMEQSAHEYVSKLCGKTTIDHMGISESKGQSGSYSIQHQIMGRSLINPDEVARLKGKECILIIRGCPPFRSKKYNLTKHENYKLTGYAAAKNQFSVEQRDNYYDTAFFDNVTKVSTHYS